MTPSGARAGLQEAGEAYGSYEAGYAEFAFALNLGTWTVLIEPYGFQGSLIEPLTALSRGTEVVSVQRHDNADHGFRYARDDAPGHRPPPRWHPWPGRGGRRSRTRHPLTQGPPRLRDPAQETAVLHILRGAPDPA